MELKATRVQRDETPIVFVRCSDDVAAIQKTWARFEGKLGLRGRKFYGAMTPGTGEYRACAERMEGDDPGAIGVEIGVLPGGAYLRARLRGEPPALYAEIGPTFEALEKDHPNRGPRPNIEFYRSRTEIDLLVPVD